MTVDNERFMKGNEFPFLSGEHRDYDLYRKIYYLMVYEAH